jgi:transposase-like protein
MLPKTSMTGEPSPSEAARFRSVSVSQKVKAVLRLLEGAAPEDLARELEVSAERLRRWKQKFIAGGRASLMQRGDHDSARARLRRNKLFQWAALLSGLVIVIWSITRLFGGAS